MPIAGLSDRKSVDPQFHEIARIRKGAAKGSGGQMGADLDYFRFVPKHRDPDLHEMLETLFYRLYGNAPDALRNVYFPYESLEENFSSWREKYGRSGLCQLRCDGARWHDWTEGAYHRHSDVGKECTFTYRDSENRCPECPLGYYGRLSIILSDMWEADPRAIGLITVVTSSINDIGYIPGQLVAHEPLTNKPFILWRAPERIGFPMKKQDKRGSRDSSLIHLELDAERQRLSLLAGTRRDVALLEREAGVVDGFYTEVDLSEEEKGAVDHEADLAEAKREAEGAEVEPESVEPPAPIELVPAPEGLTRDNLPKTAARMLPGYEDVGKVMLAMLHIYGTAWSKSDDWTPKGAWAQLQEHKAAPRGEA